MAGDAGEAAERSYGGLPGALPYAFRRSDSRLFKSYVVVGGLVALGIVVFFGMAVVVAVSETLGAVGGTFTFSRAFVLFVGLLVVVPVLAPILLVARRHRRGGSTRTYDRALAASGYLFVPAMYLLLVITAPPDLREAPPAALAPVVEWLYALPPVAGVVPPLVAAAVTYLVHRRYRAAESEP
jgi:hypothetical protein